jgi:hypothetical protein
MQLEAIRRNPEHYLTNPDMYTKDTKDMKDIPGMSDMQNSPYIGKL